MSAQRSSTPSDNPEQVARAKRLREAIIRVGRQDTVPKSPRAFTDRAAAEAARRNREESK
jgi:hypothetical protein